MLSTSTRNYCSYTVLQRPFFLPNVRDLDGVPRNHHLLRCTHLFSPYHLVRSISFKTHNPEISLDVQPSRQYSADHRHRILPSNPTKEAFAPTQEPNAFSCIPPVLTEPATRAARGSERIFRYVAVSSAMRSLAADQQDSNRPPRRPRFLCLHGFRTSGAIMRTQVVGKWPEEVTARLDLVFPDAPFPAEGKSEVEAIFPPPYYEWFQFDKDFLEYRNLDECFANIEDVMIEQGPFDGLMGFSQGAILSAALVGLQERGLALTRVPKVKHLIIIGGAKFPSPTVAEKAYASAIKCTSLHFLGDMDFLKKHGEALLDCFINPYVIRHPKGHTVPRLDDRSLETMLDFLQKIENDFSCDATLDDKHEEVYLS